MEELDVSKLNESNVGALEEQQEIQLSNETLTNQEIIPHYKLDEKVGEYTEAYQIRSKGQIHGNQFLYEISDLRNQRYINGTLLQLREIHYECF